ncbi:hypothetical protein C7S13_7071 [Burkholderia cepacia]|nr:hypothetical protein [Burkholderia cepacia]MDW9249267.1 hypothetical protein [Burkholderia cepacia]QOH38579.1 hypothetical protein C7S14_1299 [Burkholderia cepacia]
MNTRPNGLDTCIARQRIDAFPVKQSTTRFERAPVEQQ